MTDGRREHLGDESFGSNEEERDGGAALTGYEQVMSSINDLARTLQEHDRRALDLDRYDLLSIRTASERMSRRAQLSHATTDQERDRALWWFSENGNDEDLRFLRSVKSTGGGTPLLEMTIRDTERRLLKMNFNRWLRVFTMVAGVVIAVSIFIVFCLWGPTQLLTVRAGGFVLVLSIGLFTTSLLFIGSVTSRRNPISTVCFATAGFLMLLEVASVIHGAIHLVNR